VADYSTTIVDSTDGVTTVTLNRPDRLNGMTNLMACETHDALQRVAVDPHARVLVLTGAGDGFCPGADLWALTNNEPDVELAAEWFQVPALLHTMPAVSVAAINSACAGAGLGWAAACDFRFAARNARFSTAFLAVSVAGDMGLPWSLPRLVGAARARELSFFPDKFTADDALRMGLVSAVFDDTRFRGDVAARVGRLTAAAPTALRNLKLNYLDAERLELSDFLGLETARHLQLFHSPAARAGFQAFTDRQTAARLTSAEG
jgi:2-(1,2-epoxy-1,2-dihydrophenyl)acetyl-CoA isomerase